MSLVIKLTSGCRCTDADWRRYADLLRANDAKSIDELKSLMIKLHKTARDVADDARVVNDVIQLQAQIGAGRNTESRTAELWKTIQGHEVQTKNIVEQRRQEIQPVYEERSALLQAKDTAIGAIDALGKLKTIHPELLSDIVVTATAELG